MGFNRVQRTKNILFYNLTCIFVVALVLVALLVLRSWNIGHEEELFTLRYVENSPEIQIASSALQAKIRDRDCNFFNCFDVFKCGYSGKKLSIYIYPIKKFVDDEEVLISVPFSVEFMEILRTIYSSPYYEPDPKKACIFVISLDLLNQNNVRLKETSQILSSLPYWNSGTNHLLFNFLPGSVPDYNPVLEIDLDRGMIAGAGFSTWTYRKTHDISIPVFSLLGHPFDLATCKEGSRQYLATSAQNNIHFEYRNELEDLSEEHPELLVLNRCSQGNTTLRCRGGETFLYPEVLEESTFCLIIRGARLGQTTLSDAMKAGCIPVIVADGYVLPFAENIDWQRASISVFEENLADLIHILKSVSDERISEMRSQACFLWEKYFSSISHVTNAVLNVLNSRIFPHHALTYEDWNNAPGEVCAL
ncbi:Exostosin-2 [Araneus ventricosus]|uniref:Exostosin-2 n=1 Tax=Araneus ventricosus TaxID=182803 RepID=A0A4Y2CWF7_ARAVE|nr:Exostosin-2 [Araneus ventricosus]